MRIGANQRVGGPPGGPWGQKHGSPAISALRLILCVDSIDMETLNTQSVGEVRWIHLNPRPAALPQHPNTPSVRDEVIEGIEDVGLEVEQAPWFTTLSSPPVRAMQDPQ
ncbi:unnamed protein product [Gadus morhua 'NCC']